jgi:imidazolonepropionase-like amidohydrolase
MTGTLRSAAILLGLYSAAMTADMAEPHAEVVVRDVAIVDRAGRLVPHRDLVVQGTRLVRVSPSGAPLPPAKTTIEGGGKFAIAGLIDAQVATAALSLADAQALLARGITAVGDRDGDPALLERWRRDLATGRRYAPKVAPACPGGRGVSAGSTAANPAAVHDALAALVASGRTSAQAIGLFTHDNAAALCLADTGEIAEGRVADVLVLTANPLADIRHTRAIDAVIFRGEVLSQAHLAMLRRGSLPPPTPPAR